MHSSTGGKAVTAGYIGLGVSVLMFLALAVGCSKKQEPESDQPDEKVFATVNNSHLTESGLRALVPNDFYDKLSPQHRQEIINEWVNNELLYQEAVKMKLDGDPEIARILENTKHTLLVNELLERKLGDIKAPGDPELQKYYDGHKRNFILQDREYKVRYALFASRKDADAFWKQVKSKSGFSELAKQQSIDPSAQSGGDIGTVSEDAVDPGLWQAIGNTVRKYGKVKISDPFQVSEGWACVIVDEVFEPGNAKPFAAVREQVLEMYMTDKRDEAKKDLLKKLTSGARITYDTKSEDK